MSTAWRSARCPRTTATREMRSGRSAARRWCVSLVEIQPLSVRYLRSFSHGALDYTITRFTFTFSMENDPHTNLVEYRITELHDSNPVLDTRFGSNRGASKRSLDSSIPIQDYTISIAGGKLHNFINRWSYSFIFGYISHEILHDGHVYRACAQNRVGALPGGRYVEEGSRPFFRERCRNREPACKVGMLNNQKELDFQNLCSATLR